MAERNFTLVFYYVPEDKDDVDVPNAFGIKKAIQDLRLTDIQAQFPLEGQYHFRFKYKHGTEYVWLDLVNPNCKIPMIDGRIVMKVTRKSWTNSDSSRSFSVPVDQPMTVPVKSQPPPAKKGPLLEGLDSPKIAPAEAPFRMDSVPIVKNVTFGESSKKHK